MLFPVLGPTSRARSRVLAIAERLPRPDESSGSCRFRAILRHLARHAQVELWVERDETCGRSPLRPDRVAADRAHLADLGVHVWPSTWRDFRRAITEAPSALVLFEVYDMAARYLPVVRDAQPGASLVIDSVDVHFARLATGVRLGTVSAARARKVRRTETAAYGAADAVIVVSSEDAGVLSAEPHMPPIIVVPNSVTLRPRARVAREPEALFVGHFRHAPNLDGLQWFVREIWPRVRQQRADARLTVIGSYPSADVIALGGSHGVNVLGYVQNLQPFVDRAAVAVAPLRFGAGMKGKVTDALAAGLPVVTTTVGAQGLDIVHGAHAMVTDDPDAFADAVTMLCADAARADAMGRAGQHLVDRCCGPEAMTAALGELMAVPRRDPSRPGARGPAVPLLRRARAAGRYALWSAARRVAAHVAPSSTGLAGAGGESRQVESRPRLLAIAECLPRPDVSAGSTRFLAMLAQLARVARVDLWVEHDETQGDTPLSLAMVAADRERLAQLGVRVLPCTWAAYREALSGEPYDTVLFEFYYTAARYLRVVRAQWPDARVVVDSVDLHYARLAAGASLGTVPPAWASDVRRVETTTYRYADAILVASVDDAEVLRRELGMPPTVCVPVCVTSLPRQDRVRPPHALFVGHFRHDPNLDGIAWFVRDVWPQVRARHAEARLSIIGSYPSPAVQALAAAPGVDVLGYVPDLVPHVDRAMVAIAPLRFGAGMKGKVADAMAASLPVVTTRVGAQGLGLVHGEHALIADDAQAFADALAWLFDDPARAATMGRAGQAHIRQVCGPEAVAAALQDVLNLPRRRTSGARREPGLAQRLRVARLGWYHWQLSRSRRRATGAPGTRTTLTGQASGA